MKVVIASDIHGSAEHCEKLLERYRLERGERLLLLGDILHGAAWAKDGVPRVCELLREVADKVVCVRGNCDLAEDRERLGFELREGFAVFSDGERRLILTHGHIYNEHKHPKMEKGDLLLCGHSHEKLIRRLVSGGYIVNPGSVSSPRDGRRGSYAVYDGQSVEIKYLDGEPAMRLEL